MKKLFLSAALTACLSGFCACHNTRVLAGTIYPEEPVVKLVRSWNHHLIGGLVPLGNTTMLAFEYTNRSEDYIVKTNVSFLNGLATAVTAGLYAPNTTTLYVPLRNTLYK
jgi:hypothetical protein